jgi:hypothetical protein
MAKQSLPLRTDTIAAAGAITAYRMVGFNGAQATVQGQKVLGAAAYAAADGQDLAVVTIGSAIVEAGAALDPGDGVIADAQGRAIPSTGALAVAAGAVAVTSSAANGAILQGGDAPEFVFGDVAPGSSAAQAGDFVEILLRR